MLSLRKHVIIVIGSLLISIGTNFFLVPHKILDGGVIGIALIANYVFDLHIGFVIVLCGIPMFIAAWVLNREIFYNSLSGMLISSFMIDLLSPLRREAAQILATNILFSAQMSIISEEYFIMQFQFKDIHSSGARLFFRQIFNFLFALNMMYS